MEDNKHRETVFEAYAAYYDLLYKNKDYRSESAYVNELILDFAHESSSIFELGCGTGAHASCLIDLGFAVAGVDRSAAMVAQARAKVPSGRFEVGDIRDYRSVDKYDVVVSLFHVISYQVTNYDLRAAIRTAAAHLKRGGVFIFDCWYGPGVLSFPPEVRVSRMRGDAVRVTRIAEPFMDVNRNVVDVHYEIIVEDEQFRKLNRIREVHSMRYLFAPEIALFLDDAGMRIRALRAWMSSDEPKSDTWNACFVAEHA